MKKLNRIMLSYCMNKIKTTKGKEQDMWIGFYFKVMDKVWSEMTLQEKYKVDPQPLTW